MSPHVVESSDGSTLTAQLASRYFRPGGVVKGFVQLATRQQISDARTEISYVIAQVHGHIAVDSNLLTLPVVHLQSPLRGAASNDEEQSRLDRHMSKHELLGDNIDASLPDVRNFSGDTGTCIFRSGPSVLLSDLNIAPNLSETEARTIKKSHGASADTASVAVSLEAAREETAKRCMREFAIALPKNMCPSFRGTSARVFYLVSITVQGASPGTKAVSIHLPFDVYGAEYLFEASTVACATDPVVSQDTDACDAVDVGKSTEATADEQQAVGGTTRVGRLASLAALAPVGVRKGSELAFELRPSLMHGRVETELLQRPQTSIFTIGKDSSHLVRFLLTKQSYQPGDILLGMFDFTRASIPCYEVSATLCLEETLSTRALEPGRVVQSNVFGSFRERTLGVLQTNARFSIPYDALPTINTDLVRFQWLLRFEFSAGAAAAPQPTPSTRAASSRQMFQWHVPIVVQPAVATDRHRLANVPHKLYSGSTRVADLSSSS
uniref:Rgp1 n=1 Tax=Peronospora matthiolae TaxID=2874970 RepID=A0AAV1TT99_9STRA